MSKLIEVKEAKALMTEAMNWSVFKWLWEKRNVRQTADRANAALDRLNRKVKADWRDDFKAAYQQLIAQERALKKRKADTTNVSQPLVCDPEVLRSVMQVKELDAKAHAARMDAEETFDQAERELNTDLARQGCKKAIRSWELHEAAIQASKALVNTTVSPDRSA